MIVGCQSVHLMPGDFIFGLKSASKELLMSIQSIRTLLDFLKTTQNLTIKSTNKFSIVSIINWNTYQQEENEINIQINKPLTNKQQTTNNKQECKELKNVKKESREIFQIPTIQEISNYCIERKNKINPQLFFDKYTGNGWMVGKNKMKDWKAVVRTWEQNDFGGNNANTGNKGTNTYRKNNNDQRQLDPGTAEELEQAAFEWQRKTALRAAGKIPG